MEHLQSKPSARDQEEYLLACCAAAAQGSKVRARDSREANVFHVAAMILGQNLYRQARNLGHASEHYFGAHPQDKLEPAEVIRRGWIISLPRLRDMLTRRLEGRA
jgi:hypothetical protein